MGLAGLVIGVPITGPPPVSSWVVLFLYSYFFKQVVCNWANADSLSDLRTGLRLFFGATIPTSGKNLGAAEPQFNLIESLMVSYNERLLPHGID